MDTGHLGIKDDNILSLLHRRRRVTFFTQDKDFFRREFCHSAYCLLWLDVRVDDTAYYVRRVLRHPRFETIALRLGIVARARPSGVHFWQRDVLGLQSALWPT